MKLGRRPPSRQGEDLTSSVKACHYGHVVLENVSLRFFDREPAIGAVVEIDPEFASEKPLSRIRGRILEIGGADVLADLRIQPGAHTIAFADGRQYEIELIQQGAHWFTAKLIPRQFKNLSKPFKAMRDG